MSVSTAIQEIKRTLPADGSVTLVAVSKFHPAKAIREAYDAGQRVFAESRVQEFIPKANALPDDIRWHFIGHLQTNKVRPLLATGRVALIESVDSERLLRAIDAEAERQGIIARVLLQVHVAREETKFGFLPDELLDLMRSGVWRSLRATHLCGIMGMASNTDDEERIRRDFKEIKSVHDAVKNDPSLADLRGFDIVSMGMSGDYPLAVEEGSNMVRVGSAIFGPRNY